jgi:3-oxoacyl-[acyl-carrier protein] reductase
MSVVQSLVGKVALVTDGSRGVGSAVVQRLAEEGAIVLVTHVADAATAREFVTLIEASGSKATAVETHSTAHPDVESAIAEAVARFGRIDIFVSSADFLGLAGDQRALDSRPVTVRPPLAPVEVVLSRMQAGGRIIATAHVSAVDSPFQTTIRSSRIALRLRRRMAREFVARGITVNLVQSGEMNQWSLSEQSDAASEAEHCITRRSRTGVDVASLVAYLASEEAGFISGAALSADGGSLR